MLELANLGGAQLDPQAVQLRGQRSAEVARLVVREIPAADAFKVTTPRAGVEPGSIFIRRLTLAGRARAPP